MPPLNHVYCDESHIDTHTFRVQGGIWVPEIGMRAVRDEFTKLREKHPTLREFKWSYVTGAQPMRAYRDLIDLFFASDAARFLSFKCLVVRRTDDVSRLADKAGKDLGFYKAYYVLLRYRLHAGADHHVRLDEKSSPRAFPAHELGQCLNRAALRDLEYPFRVLTCRHEKSKSEDLLQLADVLCGAVAWAWNGRKTKCAAKPILHQYIVDALGWRTLERGTYASETKVNIWPYRPYSK